MDNGGGENAIATLQAALKLNPAIPICWARWAGAGRANHRDLAITYLEQALKAGQQSTSVGLWQSLLQTNRYWLAIDNGDKALAKGDIAVAEQHYQQARALDNTDSYALIGTGDVALARKNDTEAERLFREAAYGSHQYHGGAASGRALSAAVAAEGDRFYQWAERRTAAGAGQHAEQPAQRRLARRSGYIGAAGRLGAGGGKISSGAAGRAG